MIPLVAKRLLGAVPTLLVISFLVFVLLEAGEGDAAARLAGEGASPELIADIREELRLDDPFLARYGNWLTRAASGDFGESFSNGVPARDLVLDRIGVTFSVALVSVVFALLIGGTAGLLAALRPGSIVDRLVSVLAAAALAAPLFWLALILVLMFSVQRQWLPSLGYVPFAEDPVEWFRHLVLPGIALAAFAGAELTLQLKGSLAEVLRRDYSLAVQAKGMTRSHVVMKHGLKNAAVPVVTVLGFRLAQLLGGTVVIESVFSLPGVGALALQSALNRDVPVTLAVVILTTLVVIGINLLVDLSYLYFNPKLRS